MLFQKRHVRTEFDIYVFFLINSVLFRNKYDHLSNNYVLFRNKYDHLSNEKRIYLIYLTRFWE
jgi:hypothetical protein